MKEATAELNLSVVVLLIIGVLFLFFYGTVWPDIKSDFDGNTKCNEAICECHNRDANGCHYSGGEMITCQYKDKDGNLVNIKCPWKG